MNTLLEYYRLRDLYIALDRRKNVMGGDYPPCEEEGKEIEIQQKLIADKINILSDILEKQNGKN